jgi:hypothetical protein
MCIHHTYLRKTGNWDNKNNKWQIRECHFQHLSLKPCVSFCRPVTFHVLVLCPLLATRWSCSVSHEAFLLSESRWRGNNFCKRSGMRAGQSSDYVMGWTAGVLFCHMPRYILSPPHPPNLLSVDTNSWVPGDRREAVPITDRAGPWGCETSRLPHFLDNRLTDGGEVASLTCQPPFTPQEDSWYSFLLEDESTPGP